MMFWSSFWLIWVKIPLVNRSFSQCFVQIPVARLKILSKNVVFFKLSSKKGAVLSFARDIFDLKCSKTSILADFGVFAGFTFWFFVSGYRSRGTSFQKSTEAYIEKCTKNPPKFGGVDKSPYDRPHYSRCRIHGIGTISQLKSNDGIALVGGFILVLAPSKFNWNYFHQLAIGLA